MWGFIAGFVVICLFVRTMSSQVRIQRQRFFFLPVCLLAATIRDLYTSVSPSEKIPYNDTDLK